MMTVLVIIGLMSSAVILTLPQSKTPIDIQSEALLRGVNGMAQASLISGVPAALGLSEDGYALMHFENGKWETEYDYEFSEGLTAEFTKDGTVIELSETRLPLALFESNGLSTPFTLTLSDGDMVFLLESTGDGRVVRSHPS